MTHKNIVRYYQAWVEGGGAVQETDVIEEEGHPEDCEDDDFVDAGDVLATEDGVESDDENNGVAGWWTNSPSDRDLPKEMTERSDDSDSDVASTSSWSAEDSTDDKASSGRNSNGKLGSSRYKRASSSLSDMLEHENDQHFGVRKPCDE